MKKFADQQTLGLPCHIQEDNGRYTKINPETKAYLELMGRMPPENKYTDKEWPVGPVKAKRLAQELTDGIRQ